MVIESFPVYTLSKVMDPEGYKPPLQLDTVYLATVLNSMIYIQYM